MTPKAALFCFPSALAGPKLLVPPSAVPFTELPFLCPPPALPLHVLQKSSFPSSDMAQGSQCKSHSCSRRGVQPRAATPTLLKGKKGHANNPLINPATPKCIKKDGKANTLMGKNAC